MKFNLKYYWDNQKSMVSRQVTENMQHSGENGHKNKIIIRLIK